MPHFVSNGHRIHYREQGTGPLLLILPGNTASSACHLGELAYFAARCHTVAVDFWGTGLSDRLDLWPDDWFERGAQDVLNLIAHLDEDPAIVMGTSGGAWVALWMGVFDASSADRRLVRAIVADSTIAYYPPASLRAEMQARQARTPDQIAFWRAAQGDNWAQVVDADSDMLLQQAERGGRIAPERLDTISCPVLLTATLDDGLLHEPARQLPEMAEQIPDARVYLVKGGGHPLMWSRPEIFRGIVDLFLQEIDA